MLLPVDIDDVWIYPKTGTRYRVEGKPTLRNHDPERPDRKWVPAVRYVTIDPKDPVGQGDNQEFVRELTDFQRNFRKENVWNMCVATLPEGACPECGGECYIILPDKEEAEICRKCNGSGEDK